MSRLFTVYRHISPVGKVYIGITCQKVERRWKNGLGYRDSTHIFRAIMKYGWSNFKHEILFTNLTEKEAIYWEQELIRHYKGLGISYNITDGGEGTSGFRHSSETKSEMSKSKIQFYSNKEHRKHLSNAGKRNKGNKYNRKSGFTKGFYQMRNVLQFSLSGEYISKYKSAREASIQTDSNYCQILKCLKGRGKTANNFIWKYE